VCVCVCMGGCAGKTHVVALVCEKPHKAVSAATPCACVCVWICVCACGFVCVRGCVDGWVFERVCMCVRESIYVCVCVYMWKV